MMLVCLVCGEVYDHERIQPVNETTAKNKIIKYRCPKVTCRSKSLVDVDEPLIPIVVTLFQKGYITEHSCATHSHGEKKRSGSKTMYIMFVEDHLFESVPCPEGFKHIRKESGTKLEELDWDRNLTQAERRRMVFERLEALHSWSEALPPHKNCKYYRSLGGLL